MENYADLKVSKSSVDIFCKPSRDHMKRNNLILKKREKRLKAEKDEKNMCESFDYNQFKMPKKNCYSMKFMPQSSLSSCKFGFNDAICDNFCEKVETEVYIPNGTCKKYKKNIDDNVAIQKIIEKFCHKPPLNCKVSLNLNSFA